MNIEHGSKLKLAGGNKTSSITDVVACVGVLAMKS